MRLLAMVAAHNEMRYLPRWIANVAPHVDGIVALDDRSTDGSGEFLEQQDGVIEIERVTREQRTSWDEAANHRRLTEMAVAHGADWAIGIDPDERLEDGFRARAEEWIEWAEGRERHALSVKVKELWGSGTTYRADGYWDEKRKDVLFDATGPMTFDERPLHGSWAPYAPKRRWWQRNVWHPLADLIVYHCKMIHSRDRQERLQRYLDLDPTGRWNPGGYEYLVDEKGLRLEQLPAGRGYTPLEP